MFNKQYIYCLYAIACCAILLAACNKSYQNQLQSAEENNPPQRVVNKVLMVTVDGFVGTEIKKIAPPVISGFTSHSIYSYNALSTRVEDTISLQQGWATLFTGVGVSKHMVNENTSTNNFQNYPTVFSRLKTSVSTTKTVSISTNQEFNNVIAADASEKFLFINNDDQAHAKATELLKQTDANLTVVQYSSPEIAGRTGGYVASSQAYMQAVLKVDTYINQLVKTLESRPAYAAENWLIVISSGRGSNIKYEPTSGSWNGFDDAMSNPFIVFYNPRFQSQPFSRPVGLNPYIGTGYNFKIGHTRYADRTAVNTLPYSNTIFGANSEYTIQCKFKVPVPQSAAYGYAYPGWLGFRQTATGTPGGIMFTFNVNNLHLRMRNADGSSELSIRGTANVTDDRWHTVTTVRRKTGTTFTTYLYIDGVQDGAPVVTTTRSFNVNLPFCVGMLNYNNNDDFYSPSRMNITDIRIYDTALDASYLSNNFCLTDVPANDTYYNNLQGYWKGDFVARFINNNRLFLFDYSANRVPLYIDDPNGEANTLEFNETTSQLCPPISPGLYTTVPNTIDVSYQIYTWLGITPSGNWGLDGRAWSPTYIDVTP